MKDNFLSAIFFFLIRHFVRVRWYFIMNFRFLFYLFYKTIRLRLSVLQLTDEAIRNIKNLTKKNEHYIYNNVHFLKHNF